LTLSQFAVQSSHAAILSSQKFGPYLDNTHIVLCYMENEQELKDFSEYLEYQNIPNVKFYEPDLDNSLTSISTGLVFCHQRKHFRKLSLFKENCNGK
jgi:hypothetical protein